MCSLILFLAFLTAVILFGSKGRWTQGRKIQITSLVLCGIACLFLTNSDIVPCSSRVVVLTAGDIPVSDWKKTVENLEKIFGNSIPFQIGVNDSNDSPWQTNWGKNAERNGGHQQLDSDAVKRAVSAFSELRSYRKFFDFLFCVKNRIILAAAREMPTEVNIDIAKIAELSAEFKKESIQFDVLYTTSQEQLRLDVQCSEKRIPANESAVKIKGKILLNIELTLPDNTVFDTTKTASLKTEIDGKEKNKIEVQFRQIGDSSKYELILKPEQRISLQEVYENESLPQLGFHRLDVTLENNKGKSITAHGAAYLHAVARKPSCFVVGRGTRFNTVKDKNTVNLYFRDDKNLTAALEIPEENIVLESDFSPIKELPPLLILHDMSDGFWKNAGIQTRLREYVVRDGGNLFVCGFPKEDVDFLPVRLDTNYKLPMNRQPRLTFVFDDSTLGMLPFWQPDDKPYSTNVNEFQRLANGAGIQLEFIKAFYDDNIVKSENYPRPGSHFLNLPGITIAGDFTVKSKSFRNFNFTDSEPAKRYLQAEILSRRLCDGSIERIKYASSINRLNEITPSTQFYESNHIIVLFVYNIPVEDVEKKIIELLKEGKTIVPIILESPFSIESTGQLAKDYFKNLHQRNKEQLFDPEIIRLNTNAEVEVKKIAKKIFDKMKNRLYPVGEYAVKNRDGRFFDERILNIPQWAAPFVYQKLEVKTDKNGFEYASLFFQLDGQTGNALRKEKIPLAVGCPLGKGSILCTAYSPFDGLSFYQRAAWATDENIVVHQLSKDDRWGVQRLVDYASLTADLQDEKPQVTEVIPLYPKGRLRIVMQCVKDYTSKTELKIGDIKPSLVDYDPQTDYCVFELLPSQLPVKDKDKRQTGDSKKLILKGVDVQDKDVPEIYCAFPDSNSDLGFLPSCSALARYSGGGEFDIETVAEQPEFRSNQNQHSFFAFLTAFCVAVIWMIRATRNFKWYSLQSAMIQKEQKSFDFFPEDSIRGFGQSSGKPTAKIRYGECAGFRTFEPGDNAQSILLEDIIRMSNPAPGDVVIPRVALHLDEGIQRLNLLVQLGSSMRFPRLGKQVSSKIHIAARIAGILASDTLRRQSEVFVYPLGLNKHISPLHQIGGNATDVYYWILETAKQAADDANTTIQYPEIEFTGSSIYLSDFYQEDDKTLTDYLCRMDLEIGPAAGFFVYSQSEFYDLGVGRFSRFLRFLQQGGICDRSEWLPEDLQWIHQQRMEYWRSIFESNTRGGLVSVDADWLDSDIQETIQNSRVGEVLKK